MAVQDFSNHLVMMVPINTISISKLCTNVIFFLKLSFLIEFCGLDRYDRPIVTVRPKKKRGYLPPLSLEEGQPEKATRKLQVAIPRRIAAGLNRSVDSSARRRSESLSDMSYISTASSSSNKGKQKVLVGNHRLVNGHLPEVMMERALHPHGHIPYRYKESPYVQKFKNSPRGGSKPLGLDLGIEIPAGLNYKKQQIPTPSSFKSSKNSRGSIQKNQ